MYLSLHDSGITFETLVKFAGGTPVNAPKDGAVAYGISTDTRSAKEGDVFIALKGENYDAHDFIADAVKAGCVFVVCERVPDGCTVPCVVVDDTTAALGKIAAGYKRLFHPISIAVTGSVGKTTAKEFIYSVVDTKYKTNKSHGNFNNEIGVPLTLFNLTDVHKLCLLEFGMDGAGQISNLSKIAEPDISIITNIGTSHMEHLGSKENILKAKMEIIDGMKPGGILILNGDDPMLRDVEADGICKIYVGIENNNCTYSAENIRMFNDHMLFDINMHDGEIMKDIRINVIGKHNIMNALYACVCGIALMVPEDKIREGLLNFTPTAMRQNMKEKENYTVIEDCYNASPESMKAGLEVLCHTAETRGLRPVAVLGDMLELGSLTNDAHFAIGERVASCNVARLVTFGKAAAYIAKGAMSCGMSDENITVIEDTSDIEKAAAAVKEIIRSGDVVLFKASRAMALERIIALL